MSFLPGLKRSFFNAVAALLSLFIIIEVNYPQLAPQSQLAIFAMLGLILLFLKYPVHSRFAASKLFQILDVVLMCGILFCFMYVILQTEPAFRSIWLDGQPLGNRAGIEQPLDYVVGLLGLILVLEGTRRAIGWTLPILSLIFLAYAAYGSALPNWLFPHRGYGWERIVSQTFLHSQGVFGIALNVMFTYVFLFVLFGTLLEKTGATGFIILFAKRLFRKSPGGPAKVAVISSGMMGSLSGSAVANTATTGTFTIPMMKSSGFKPAVAAGVEAAASSGGALMPPIMGAGAYMMLEIVEPPVTYLQIIKAALVPAVLYYLALLFIVHFQAKKVGASADLSSEAEPDLPPKYPGFIFFGAFAALIVLLVIGYTPFRAVTVCLMLILALAFFNQGTRVRMKGVLDAMVQAAHGGVPLIAAASCVGVILGVVTLTGVGTKLPGAILPLAQNNLILALILLMVSTIILGMGLPSAVCYLLMATLVGPILSDLNIVPLAAHLFIFYFGMMSMVTPPVALAAYTAAAIADAKIMQAGFAAFRFALVGFALPYAFVLRPELLLLSPDGGVAGILPACLNIGLTILGILGLAASVTGFWFGRLSFGMRTLLLGAAFAILLTRSSGTQIWLQGVAVLTVIGVGMVNWRQRVSAKV